MEKTDLSKGYQNPRRKLRVTTHFSEAVELKFGKKLPCILCILTPFYNQERMKDEGRERIPHTWASSDENDLKCIFGSVSYCVVILRTTSHWSVTMASCYFRLLT